MVKLKTFLYCESINMEPTQNAPKLNLVGPLQVLTPMFIPGMFSFSIFMNISGEEVCNSGVFRVVFKKAGSNENIIDTGNQMLPGVGFGNGIPNEEHGFMINMDFRNVVIREEGLYVSEVYFNNEKVGESGIYAKAAENNG